MASVGTWLSDSIRWLNAQEAGTQQVVAGAVVAIGSSLVVGSIAGARFVFRRLAWRAADRRRAREEAARDALAARLEFESSPAELGELDHGLRLTSALAEVQELAKAAVPPIVSLLSSLKNGAKTLPSDIDKKRAAIGQIAESLRPEVVTLEGIAASIGQPVQEWTDAYRAIFTSTAIKAGDKRQLAELQRTYQGGVADTFRQLTDLFRLRGVDIDRFKGKQQDLNRVVSRASAAIGRIAAETDKVEKFCAVELPALVSLALANAGAPEAASDLGGPKQV
ncbi:MAG: hypothetical protein U1E63_17945 [Burkholderiales bacterium]